VTNRHFGRISEVWKHLVLAEVLAAERPRSLLDTHAGDAVYPVVDDPERSYGVLAFDNVVDRDPVLGGAAYATVLSTLRSDSKLTAIPGGPLVAMDVLGNAAEYLFCDLDPDSSESIRRVAASRGIRTARVLAADGMESAHVAIATREAASVVVFVDPFDHHAAGPSGMSALDLALEVARAGARLVYWYGYSTIDRRHWIVDELAPSIGALDWWCGDVMVSAADADMTAGDLGEASSPGTGSGLVCVNVSTPTVERCSELGTALAAAYRDRPLPSGRTGRLDFLTLSS
jgi:23S rRNA A2030 N6-methylase RlmJ